MNKSLKLLSVAIAVLSIVSFFPKDAAGAISPTDLKTEGMTNPLGVDVAQPGFSWVLTSAERGQRQNAYSILVASSEAVLAGDVGDIWSSGQVSSNAQNGIIYQGPALQSDKRYYWKVRVWDKDNVASAWSASAYWEMGLLSASNWQGAWVGTTTERPSPLFRKDFTLSKTVRKATAHVFGLGWYEMRLNGAKVGDRVLAPANCIYQYTMLYDSYDVTSMLRSGGNTVGLWLANGYGSAYSQWGFKWTASKRAILQLNIEYTDNTTSSVVTDNTWQASTGPITAAEMYNGETYDARLEKTGWDVNGYNASGWEAVASPSSPGGTMKSNMMPPVRVVKILQPVAMRQPSAGVYVYDLGQNIAGWVRVHVRGGSSGTTIVLRHAEDAYSDGTLDLRTNRAASATDTYICRGGATEEIYEPRFTYHGFRFVELRGYPGTPTLSTIEGCATHADVDSIGTFSCSNALFNRIHRNCQWGMLNNMVSITTDNAVRDERTPCLMDYNCYIEAAINNFDVLQYFKNWQTVHPTDNGTYFTGNHQEPQSSVGHIWGPWLLYQYYGDRRILETFYTKSKAVLDLVISGGSGTCASCYGDWCPAYNGGSPASESEVVNTTLYYSMMILLSRMAGILGRTADSTQYATSAGSVLTAFNNKFLNASNVYGSNNQVCYIMPFTCNMVPTARKTAVFNNLITAITGAPNNGHLRTGIYGTAFMFDVLCDNGNPDLAYTVLNQTTYPSFGDQINNYGATTTWEQWDFQNAMITHDHAMFAGADHSFYTRFGGIMPSTPGYRTIRIKPFIPQSLTYVNSSVKTVKGTVTSNWNRSGSTYTHQVVIPANTTALVYVPATDTSQVFESGVQATRAVGVHYQLTETGYVAYTVESGSYVFSTAAPVVNLAPCGTATASSSIETGGWSITKVNNGTTLPADPGWSSTGYQDNANHTEWVKLQLCSTQSINKVVLYPRADAGSEGYSFPVDFTIDVSTNNTNWTTVVTRTNYANPGANPQTFTFNTTTALYVRVNATRLGPNGTWFQFQLNEVEVYNIPQTQVAGMSRAAAGAAVLRVTQRQGKLLIHYALGPGERLKDIRVYNCMGRGIWLYAPDNSASTGQTGTIYWNRTTSAKSVIPAGTYIVQMKTDRFYHYGRFMVK
jgi:alpha-L-rhamnosidase